VSLRLFTGLGGVAGFLLAPVGLAAPAAEPAVEAAAAAIQPPRALHAPAAVHPPGREAESASVVLSLVVGADGLVREAVVHQSAGADFDAAALAAAAGIVFAPALRDGAPFPVRILYRVSFVQRPAPPAPPVGPRLQGVLLNRETGEPLVGVAVILDESTATRTDADGRWAFANASDGLHHIVFQGASFLPVEVEQVLGAGASAELRTTVSLAPPEDDGTIVITARAARREAVATTVSAEEARTVPGTQGDVLRVVENLPGVARAGFGSGALVVWGAAPEDTGVYVDGVRVPRLYHDGGLRSVFASDLVQSVELVPGGYGARWGRGVGGLVVVDTVDAPDVTRAIVAVDAYDASAAIQQPVGERGHLALAARRSHLGPLLEQFAPGVGDYFPIPRYADGQVRLGARIDEESWVDLTGLFSQDRTARTAPNPDPAREASEERALSFQRVYLRFSRGDAGPTRTQALIYLGADQRADAARWGPVETKVAADAVLGGGRAGFRQRVSAAFTVESGVDVEVVSTEVIRAGSMGLPAREGDIRVFGQPPPDQIAADRTTVATLNAAAWGEGVWGVWDERLLVSAGLRVDPNVRAVQTAAPRQGDGPVHGLFLRDPSLEPRVSLRATPSPRVSLLAAGGRYSQQPAPTDLGPSFGTPALGAMAGRHLVLGAGFRPQPVLNLEWSTYLTQTDGIALRNPAAQPARAEALVDSGEARAYGVQVLARLEPQGAVSGWLSSTLGVAERRLDAASPWRPSDFDQRHVTTGLVSVALPAGFDIGARARVASGLPRTPVVGALYDSRRDLYHPLFGGQNTDHLPLFFQADLRVARRFTLRRSTLEATLDIQNITNHTNVEEYVFNADFSERTGIRGLPLLPVAGLRWSAP
jgi:TonB family protein